MKNRIIKLIMLAMLGLSTFTGCKKALETTPKNSLDLTFALNTKEGLRAVLVAIYNSMQTSGYYGRDFVVIPELLADNGEITVSNSNRFLTQANNTPNNHVNIWAAAYANINRANIIIKFVDNNPQATAAEKAAWKGEAYFLRALLYHDLVKSYARAPLYLNSGTGGNFDLGVPIVTEPVVEASAISFPARKKITEVYDLIMQDLTTANALLTNTGNAYRPRKVAVHALASRVELFRGNWAQSERWADSVILQNVVPIAPNATFFNTTATAPAWGNALAENIFALTYQTGETNPGTDALQYIYYRNLSVTPAIQGYGDVTARLSLLNDLGVVANTSIDQRFTKLISIQTKSSQTVYYSTKWPGLRQLGQDDITLMRTSEVYLNRAEARAMQGGAAKEAAAIADVNQTRTRAGLTAFPTSGVGAPTGAALITEILKERRIELAFEGHRVFDILRTGRDITKSPSNIIFGSNAYNYLIAQILQADLDSNPNLVRNPG